MGRLGLVLLLLGAAAVPLALASSPGSRRALMNDRTVVIAYLHGAETATAAGTIDVTDLYGRRSHELMMYSAPYGGDRPAPLDWSGDGRHLLLISKRRGLVSLEPDGTFSPRWRFGNCEGRVSWSPNRKRIACDSGGGGINVITARGDQRLLEDRGIGDTSKSEPAWSPDGRTIAYVESDSAGVTTIRLYDLATKKSYALRSTRFFPRAAADSRPAHAPSWSRDSRRLVFARGCNDLGPCDRTIWVVRRDGSGLRLVAHDGLRPVWSPDGTEIAFDSDRDGDYEIYVIALATGRVRQLTHNHVDDINAVWRTVSGA